MYHKGYPKKQIDSKHIKEHIPSSLPISEYVHGKWSKVISDLKI